MGGWLDEWVVCRVVGRWEGDWHGRGRSGWVVAKVV